MLVVAFWVAVIVVVRSNTHGASPSIAMAVTGTPLPGTPAGYQAYEDGPDHFSIAVPSAWYDIDPTSVEGVDDQAQQSAERSNPGLSDFLGSPSPSLGAASTKFLASGGHVPNGVPSVVSVVIFRPVPPTDLGSLETGILTTTALAHAKLEARGLVALNGRSAFRATAESTVETTSGQTATNQSAIYLIDVNDTLYAVIVSGIDPALATIVHTFNIY